MLIQESMDDMELDEEKKSLITREIDKFRDAYKVSGPVIRYFSRHEYQADRMNHQASTRNRNPSHCMEESAMESSNHFLWRETLANILRDLFTKRLLIITERRKTRRLSYLSFSKREVSLPDDVPCD